MNKICILFILCIIFRQSCAEISIECALNMNITGFEVISTSDGGYACVGHTLSPDSVQNIVLTKIDTFGNAIWSNYYSNSNLNYGTCLVETANRGFAIGGYSYEADQGWSIYLVKTDSLGQVEWTTQHDGDGYEKCFDIILTPDDGFLLVGSTVSEWNPHNNDIYITKFGSDGELDWMRIINNNNRNEIGSCIIEDSNGDYVISAGYGSNRHDNMVVAKIDIESHLLWTQTYEADNDSRGITQISDGNYIAISNSLTRCNVRKINQDGELIWNNVLAGYLKVYDIITFNDNSVLISGNNMNLLKLYILSNDGILLQSGGLRWDGRNGMIEGICVSIAKGHGGNIGLLCSNGTFIELSTAPNGIDKIDNLIVPDDSEFLTLYPNPFNNRATIEYSIQKPGFITLGIFDQTGKMLELIYEGHLQKGGYKTTLSEFNYPSGQYFINLEGDNGSLTTKSAVHIK